MVTDNTLSQLAILTPSRVTTEQRYEFASASCKSLQNSLNGEFATHVVVHDSHVFKSIVPNFLHGLIKSFYLDNKARDLYSSKKTIWFDGDGRGSASAMLKAVNVAISQGKSYGFIHLDDHVYRPDFGELLAKGVAAMDEHTDLQWTRFSGYPVIFNNRKPLQPSAEDLITFDGVTLRPHRSSKYTLWSSPLTSEANAGNYWQVVMWFCVYRLGFLKQLLEWAVKGNSRHLAHVETFYRKQANFQKILDRFPKSSFGYINMQYGGIEMHRNENWRELLALDNPAIR